jgi:hypothetical protein
MEKKELEKTEKKISRLCVKYSKMVKCKESEIHSLLINFAEEYNKIWTNRK